MKTTADQQTTTNDLESNASAYFASIGSCQYIDLENLPPSSASQQLSNNQQQQTASFSSSNHPVRLIQQSNQQSSSSSSANNNSTANTNPWIRRNYGPADTSNYHQQQVHHPIPISNSKPQVNSVFSLPRILNN